jgi:A/G-specific adenine glycosylase
MPPAMSSDARAAVLAWYDASGRALPFRRSRDPWAILVSEVMAQQTQIARVADAWSRFMARFPTPAALAASSPADVLRAWQGMGYDRRAINLRRAAQAIRDEHGGHVPDDIDALQRLPGIGPYTARAIAAIAFGRAVGAVDTNVRRVLGRALDVEGAPVMQAAADASVDRARPGDWTHAVMDVGATLCRPRNPRCDACPLRPWCTFATRAATSAGVPATARKSAPAFTSTTRWLRGRIVDRLRAAPDGAWIEVSAPIGSHDAIAIGAALDALARDGLVELDGGERRLARLAIA